MMHIILHNHSIIMLSSNRASPDMIFRKSPTVKTWSWTWITATSTCVYRMDCVLLCVFLHKIRSLVVYKSTEGQAILPGRCEVSDVDSPVALSLSLTPGQQPARTYLRVWWEKQHTWCQRSPIKLHHGAINTGKLVKNTHANSDFSGVSLSLLAAWGKVSHGGEI